MLYSISTEKESRAEEMRTACVGGRRATEPEWILKGTRVSHKDEWTHSWFFSTGIGASIGLKGEIKIIISKEPQSSLIQFKTMFHGISSLFTEQMACTQGITVSQLTVSLA